MGYKARIIEIPSPRGPVPVTKEGELWVVGVVLEAPPLGDPGGNRKWGFTFAKQKDATLGAKMLRAFVAQFNELGDDVTKPQLADAVRDAHNTASADADFVKDTTAFRVISSGITAWIENLAEWAPATPPVLEGAPVSDRTNGAHDHLGAMWPEPITQQSALEHAHRRHFLHYRKKTITEAIRMAGPFTVETSSGAVTCSDGYLAIDDRGIPYPIDREEFDAIYEQVQ